MTDHAVCALHNVRDEHHRLTLDHHDDLGKT